METTEKTIEVLNDLVKINNDRVAGFENASENLEDDNRGLRPVFNKLADESRDNAAELSAKARQFNGEAEEGTSVSGTLHRAWIDVKATFTGHDLESILDECERGEDAIKSAYRSALEDSNELPYEIVQLIRTQQQGIIEGHDLIKSLRDQSKTAGNSDDNETAENEDIIYTGSVENDDWRNKEGDFKPFASNQTLEIENDQQDDLDENELALANEVPVTPVNHRKYNTTNENTRGPVDVGEYQSGESVEGVQGRAISDDSKLQEFFVNELKDLLWAEQKLVDTLPKMAEAATSAQLREAFQNHLAQTEEHVQRLEQIFGTLGLDPDTTKCDAMDGIVDEGEEIISDTDEGTATRDVGLIFAGQKVEHYEIASYGGMVSLAKTLGYTEAAGLLSVTLNEEKAADELLTEIAENEINYQAAGEQKEKGFFS
jgi:uncharacterized protein (TIGR02284 family)